MCRAGAVILLTPPGHGRSCRHAMSQAPERITPRRVKAAWTRRRYVYVSAVVLEMVAFAAVVLSFAFAALALVVLRGPTERVHGPTSKAPEAPGDEGGTSETLSRVLSDVERLAALREQGVLTDKEFAAQKAKLLRPPVRSRGRSS